MARYKQTRYALANSWQPNTARFNGNYGGLQLDNETLVRVHGVLVKDNAPLELLMTPERARSIAAALIRAADKAEQKGNSS